MKIAHDDVVPAIDDLRRLWWACAQIELSDGVECLTLAKYRDQVACGGPLTVNMEVFTRLCDRPLATARILERAGLLLSVEA